jgi:CheY-like chemotaxis protein
VARLLIADDHEQVRNLVRATVAAEAYEVLEAADGDQAWDLLQRCRPDVALLDIEMPGRTGLELTAAIRADPALAGTCVVLVTGRVEPADRAAGYAAGADHYISKPFSPLALAWTIKECLRPTRAGVTPY